MSAGSQRELLDLLAEGLAELHAEQGPLPEVCSSFGESLKSGSLKAELQLVDLPALRDVLLKTARRMQDNYPYGHPLFIGQMLKPPHPIAWLAYALAMTVNPNNHAFDGGRASSFMEREAVSAIAGMFGWEQHLGHLTGGGTLANFEALWVARESAPGKKIAASAQAHYTHSRLSSVLETEFVAIDVDPRGRMDLDALEEELSSDEIGTVVATAGTTALGAVDPIPDIVALKEKYGFRLHVDAAYGGYYRLVNELDQPVREAFTRLSDADSIAIDPHKHGLQPYGCGCILFRDPQVAAYYHHESPYTYFLPHDLHLGEISLECSRPGAAAVALWATLQLLPLSRDGEFARMLTQSRRAALELHRRLAKSGQFVPIVAPELDIVVWTVPARTASQASQRAREIFNNAAAHDLHLALANVPQEIARHCGAIEEWDDQCVTCLRSCAMKPQHLEWMPEIARRLFAAAERA